MDIRSKRPDPVAQSEDQEDELLSIVSIKGFVGFISLNSEITHFCGWLPNKGVIRIRMAKMLDPTVATISVDCCRNSYSCFPLRLTLIQLMTFLSHRASKFVVGTQLGILSIFNRSSGWGDCVDRVPGYVVVYQGTEKNIFETPLAIPYRLMHCARYLPPYQMLMPRVPYLQAPRTGMCVPCRSYQPSY